MLNWIASVASDDARYNRVTLALGAVMLAGVAGIVAITLRV
jgi:hypothetical protein